MGDEIPYIVISINLSLVKMQVNRSILRCSYKRMFPKGITNNDKRFEWEPNAERLPIIENLKRESPTKGYGIRAPHVVMKLNNSSIFFVQLVVFGLLFSGPPLILFCVYQQLDHNLVILLREMMIL